MKRLARVLFAVYVAALTASHTVRWLAPVDPRADYPGRTVTTVEPDRDEPAFAIASLEWRPDAPGVLPSTQTAVLLLHGSPGDAGNFRALGSLLAERGWRVVAPDLPGYGASTRDRPDLSIRGQARDLLGWIETIGLERAHVVGYSLGGGVMLELSHLDPDRVASATLLSSIGVQELELLGNYHLNHMVHGLQLGALWLLREGTPHFGLLDRFPLDVFYARNFFETDQRPLRDILRRLEPPTAIVHGESDFLVPVAAALEHHRLVPQSELLLLDASHFFVFRRDHVEPVVSWLDSFWRRVESAEAVDRARATPERREGALRPWDPGSIGAWQGPAVLAIVVLLALSTLVSEDLTCLGAGLLVAEGRLDLFAASLGCFLGIVLGDFAIFWIGRLVGRPALEAPPLRWWVSEEGVERSSAWLQRRGAIVIGLSRFMPGARVPTYLAAGLLRTSFPKFSLYFVVAAAIWTPLVVWISSRLGGVALEWLERARYAFVFALVALFLVMLTVQRVLLPLATHRGRRRWVGRWLRLRHPEFWPIWALYPPVVASVLWRGLRRGAPTLFTAANPAMPAGGVVGESKAQILSGLERAGVVPEWRAIAAGASPEEALAVVQDLRTSEQIGYPLVLKPDAGERGRGVAIVHDDEDVRGYFEPSRPVTLVQRFASGREFGVFYYRLPEAERGSIFSITEKVVPAVVGDGERTLEELILDDARAVALAHVYLREVEDPTSVPAAGERVPLATVGAHSRGTLFLDASDLATEALETEIDRIARCFEGFDIGRFDLRVADAETLMAGGPLQVIELNGVTSESTNLYDARYGILDIWRILGRQWRLTLDIAERRHEAGAPLTPLRELWRRWRRHGSGS